MDILIVGFSILFYVLFYYKLKKLATQRNGLTVQRKFAGLDTVILEDDIVDYCKVSYYERELYPNGEVNKLFIKTYELQDLSETVNERGYRDWETS